MCFSGVFRKIAHEDCESIHAVAPSIEKKSVSSLPEGASLFQPTSRIWLCFCRVEKPEAPSTKGNRLYQALREGLTSPHVKQSACRYC
jgi:hypothetical protein